MQAFFLKVNSCGISDCRPEWHWDINGFNDYDLWTVFRGKGKLQVGDTIEVNANENGLTVEKKLS